MATDSETTIINTQSPIIDSKDQAPCVEKPVTTSDREHFMAKLDENASGPPTQIFKNSPAKDQVTPSEATSPLKTFEDSEADLRLWNSNDKLSSQPQNLFLNEPVTFRPFNHRFLIGDEIGKGGMGLVYLGWDLQLHRHVAIKIIREDHSKKKQNLLRFLREARIASQLRHPGILGIHDFDIDPTFSAYIIMDLITGKTMEQTIDEATGDEVKRASLLTMFFQICQAIAFAHAQGVVHRDLKPANVMVADYGIATVVDWGLAKVLRTNAIRSQDAHEQFFSSIAQTNIDPPCDSSYDISNTIFGTVMGTPNYLSPEQARGEFVDYRTDVFSLGGILCHLLTGSPPFTGDKIVDIYRKSAMGDVSDAFSRLDRCGAPIPIVQLAKRCLDPKVDSRPETATFLVETLKGYLESGQRRAEEELVRFFDLSLDLFCIANTQGYFWRVNDNFTRALGYTVKELTSKPFLEFVHPDDQPKTINEVLKLSRGEPTIQFINRYRHKNGSYISLEWTARSLEEEGVIYAVARDISDRIRLEKEKARIESDCFRLTEIVNSASDAIIGKDLNGVIQSWNKGAEKLFGYTPEEMIGHSITKILPPDRDSEESIILQKIQNGEGIEHFETVRIHKAGASIDISASISPIRSASGAIIGASTIARSIVKQKQLESELSESRKSLVEFAENANIPLHCVDQTGTIIWANNAELSLLGYTKHEYIGQSIAKFHANQETINDIIDQLLQGNSIYNYRAKLIAKDGSIKDVAIYSSAFRENGKLICTRCFTIAITPQHRDDGRICVKPHDISANSLEIPIQ
jgi:serine/threonine-protein kinase